MRKLKLLLVTLALIVGGVSSAWAQGWNDITSTKVANYDFSSLEGWTSTGINGEGSGNSVKVREAFHYPDWGKNAPVIELTQAVSLAKGKYVLKGQAFHRGSGTGNLYVKVGEEEAITKALPLVGNGEYKNYPSNIEGSAQAFSANTYISTISFEVTADNESVTIGYKGTSTANNDWFIAAPVALYEIKDEISSTYPLDLTHTIDRGYNGWTYEGSQDIGNTWYAQIPIHQTYKTSALAAGNVISRSYSNLECGKYEVEVYALGCVAWGASSLPSTAPEVYANDVSLAATCIVDNSPQNVPSYKLSDVKVTNGTLNVGLRNTAEGGNFYLFNIKSIKMTEPDYATTLAEYRADAKKILDGDDPINAETLSALQSAYNNTETVEETKEAMETAIALILNAFNDANASIEMYKQIASINTQAATLDEAGQASYATTLTAYNNGTLNAVEEAQVALNTAVKAQTTDGADMTLAITNWDFLNCANNNFPGWTIETTGGNTWVHGTTAVEFWNSDLTKTFDYHQEIIDLPAGKYTLSAHMWSTSGIPNGKCGVYGTSSNATTVFAGVTDDCGDNNLHTYNTEALSIVDGTLRLGVKNNGERSSEWFGVDWIKLTLVHKYTDEELEDATCEAILAEAYSIHNSTNVPTANIGTGAFQYDQEMINKYNENAALFAGKPATVKALLQASGKWNTTDMESLLNDYKSYVEDMMTLNQPTYNDHFYLVNANSEHPLENKAAVVIDGETSANNPTGYSIKATEDVSAQIEAFDFIWIKGNTYALGVKHGEKYLYLTYGSLNGSAAGWAKQQIQLTEDYEKWGEFTISATATEGVYNIYNTEFEDFIDIQDGGSLYTDTGIDKKNFKFERELVEVPMVVKAEYKWATFCAPFAVTIPEGVTAYTVDGVLDATEQTLNMTEVETTIPANTPVVLYSAKDVNETFTDNPNYDDDPQEGLLIGVYEKEMNFSDFPNDDIYLLSRPAGCTKVAFYPVEKETSDTHGATTYSMQYKAYLMIPGGYIGAKGLFFDEDEDVTAIEGVDVLTAGEYDAIYNAAGIPVETLQKGLNIVVKAGKSYKIYVK